MIQLNFGAVNFVVLLAILAQAFRVVDLLEDIRNALEEKDGE